MSKKLPDNDIARLRESGRVLQCEIAYKEGDLIIAENPATGQKRVVDTVGLVLESSRKVLLG